jgi:foldase protein PrsA
VKRVIGGLLACVIVAGPACADPSAPGDIVATVNGQPITMSEFQKPLIEAYGLKILAYQVTLKLTRQQAALKNVVVTQDDVKAEQERTLKAGFQDAPKEDYPALLEQLLEKKGVSRSEWDMVIEQNAILRKIAAPMLKDKITEENLKEAFNMRYGQTVVVRHIQCAKPQEALQAKLRIAAGERFEDVVEKVSQNPRTAPLKGELPQFSRDTQNWGPPWGKVPQGFKDWAFNAKVGDLSDPIEHDGSFHILKLERKMEPKVVKFDDVKAGLKADLEERLMEQGIQALRAQVGVLARDQVKIIDPVMKRQWEAKLREQEASAKAMAEERAKQDLRSKVAGATTRALESGAPVKIDPSGTQGTSAATPAGSSADAPSGERPPASKSAAPGASDASASHSK